MTSKTKKDYEMGWLRENLFDEVAHRDWATGGTTHGVVYRDPVDGDILDEIWFDQKSIAQDCLAVLWRAGRYQYTLEERYHYTKFTVVKELNNA